MNDDFAAFMRSLGAEDPNPPKPTRAIPGATYVLEYGDGTRLEFVLKSDHQAITDDLQARLDFADRWERIWRTVAWVAAAIALGMAIARCL